MLRIGVDIGGTFTDFTVLDEQTGQVVLVHKLPSDPLDPIGRILAGIKDILAALPAAGVSYLIHGTTIGLNALLQQREPPPGLITTAGFRDVYEIGRQWRADQVYNLFIDPPRRLLPRRLVREVDERLNFLGEVVRPLDMEQARAAIRELLAAGVRSLAICLLHSYANPSHEQALASLVHAEDPHVYVSLSSEINPEFREYERTATTVANAYIGPKVSGYLEQMERRMEEVLPGSRVLIMQSNGGLGTPGRLARLPINTLMSGPVAGVIGARHLAQLAGFSQAITLDAGGTSCDMAVVPGTVLFATETSIGGHPVRAPSIDVHTIGSGGGSLARLGPGGVLKVGPESAGAVPGPACYGTGGTEPTLTDALVLLGRLNPEHLLDGRMPIHADLARKAMEERIAIPTGLDVTAAAEGVVRVLAHQVAASMRTITVAKGYDPREFVLVAFGGAGPTIAVEVASELGIPHVLVPPDPGNFCALGMLLTDFTHDAAQGRVQLLADADWQAMNALFEELVHRASERLVAEGVPPHLVSVERFLDLRYLGQSYEVRVPFQPLTCEGDKASLVERFQVAHGRLFGHKAEGEPIETVTYRVRAVGSIPKPRLREVPVGGDQPHPRASLGHRHAHFPETGWTDAQVYRRAELRAGNVLHGPAIVEELSSTTVIWPGQRAAVDRFGNLLIHVGPGMGQE